MRFYTQQPPFLGIDLHARPMYVCLLDQAGATLLHRTMPPLREARRKAIAPCRDQIVLRGRLPVDLVLAWLTSGLTMGSLVSLGMPSP